MHDKSILQIIDPYWKYLATIKCFKFVDNLMESLGVENDSKLKLGNFPTAAIFSAEVLIQSQNFTFNTPTGLENIGTVFQKTLMAFSMFVSQNYPMQPSRFGNILAFIELLRSGQSKHFFEGLIPNLILKFVLDQF